MIRLGQQVRDKGTGFVGIAVAKVEFMNGYTQFCVKPEMCDPGKMPEGHYIDDIQLEVVGDGIMVNLQKTPGGEMMPDTPSDRYRG